MIFDTRASVAGIVAAILLVSSPSPSAAGELMPLGSGLLAQPAVAQEAAPISQTEYEVAMLCIGTWEGALNAIPVIYPDAPNKDVLDAALRDSADAKRVNEDIFIGTSRLRDTLDRVAGGAAYQAGLMIVQAHRNDRRAYENAVNANLKMPETCTQAIALLHGKLAR